MSKKSKYTEENIIILEGLEPVRKRPGMYIGSTGEEGYHHLLWEVIDNSIDEAMAGFCTEIEVILHKDGSAEVIDNGRGIPVGKHKQTGVSALETVMTRLHAGGKFDKRAYKVSGGLHGVGVSVVNALSEFLKVEVYRDGKIYFQEYKRGVPKAKVKKIGTTKETGTRIIFKPDPIVFKNVKGFDLDIILNHLRQQAYLTKGVRIKVKEEKEYKVDEVNSLKDLIFSSKFRTYNFKFDRGIISYIKFLNRKSVPIHKNVFYIEKNYKDIKVEIAFQYIEEYKETILGFANNIYNLEGGTHITGFKSALTKTLNSFARNTGFLKEKDENFTSEDVREGLVAIISVKVPEPQFEGQTKAKLGNVEVRTAVESVFSGNLEKWLEEHPKDAEAIMKRCILAAQARKAAKAARESVIRKGYLEGFTLPGKLADCTSSDPKVSELFIVEGESAGGSAKQARDREYQAILPLKGKILNVEKARIDKILSNNELKSLVIAIGTNIGEQFDISKLRYNKIIIMTDADVDGSHIRTLLLTLFYRYFQEIIKKGHLYIAIPPLYKVEIGKDVFYAYSDKELQDLLEKIKGSSTKRVTKKLKAGFVKKSLDYELEISPSYGMNIQRYKGLGEMNPDQLWETTMDPKKRRLKKVTIQDVIKANEIFNVLMGQDVLPRKKFIEAHAKNVQNLDI